MAIFAPADSLPSPATLACSIIFVLCLDSIEYYWSSCDFGSTFSTLSLDIEIKDCELLQPITTSLV